MNVRSWIALAMIAALLGAWVRTNGMQSRWIWSDEAATLLHVQGRTGAALDERPPVQTFGSIAVMLTSPGPGGVRAVWEALAVDDPSHAPLYYVAMRLWNDAGGRALPVRAFSVLIGFAGVAAIGFLAAVVGGRRAGIAGVALSSVSPFFVLYGQQIREYGSWCALVALASALLVLAVRRGGVMTWSGYAVALSLALWTTSLSLLLVPAHAAYVAYAAPSARRARLTAFGAAAVAALVSYAPWLAVSYAQRARIASDNAWSSTTYPVPALAAKLLFTLASGFSDLAYADPRALVISAIVLLAVAAAALALFRGDRRAVLLLGSIALSTAGTLIVVDLVTGSHRSSSSRYLAPLMVVTVVAVASALARLPGRIGLAATAALVLLGAVSSYAGTASPVYWDNHGDAGVRDLVAMLSRDPATPVSDERPCSSILSLALAAPPAQTVHCRFADPTLRAAGWYVLDPSPGLVARARAHGLVVVRLPRSGAASDPSATMHAFRRGFAEPDAAPDLARFVRAAP